MIYFFFTSQKIKNSNCEKLCIKSSLPISYEKEEKNAPIYHIISPFSLMKPYSFLFFLSRLNAVSKNFSFSLRGGGKKHKKKVYTKPKKKKHVHKKIKLRVLTYFYTELNHIKKLRKISPEAPGCFMGEHLNRITCGKTGLTFVKKN
mmetsp:Transcript_39348/g.78857  ORF Transcript_39348/g.78857 Transcript_39348/m.78857 type:complete len:147 (+) Transcript_39348:3045-3485(+)